LVKVEERELRSHGSAKRTKYREKPSFLKRPIGLYKAKGSTIGPIITLSGPKLIHVLGVSN